LLMKNTGERRIYGEQLDSTLIDEI
jgi:hypothetical protein